MQEVIYQELGQSVWVEVKIMGGNDVRNGGCENQHGSGVGVGEHEPVPGGKRITATRRELHERVC